MQQRVGVCALVLFLCAAGVGVAVGAPCSEMIIISEIAWAGTAADPQDEWIELRNIGDTPVDLSGWVLRWRRTCPTTPEEMRWTAMELSGVLASAPISLYEKDFLNSTSPVRFVREDPEDIFWAVINEPGEMDGSYYTLQRRHDVTIRNVVADVIYDDTLDSYMMELSDRGEIIELLNDDGELIDTANTSNTWHDNWDGGSVDAFASMERIDPLGPDVPENWQTNFGIIVFGLDAGGRPLKATAGRANSPTLEEIHSLVDVQPTRYRSGELVSVAIAVSTEDSPASNHPSIYVTQPGGAEAIDQRSSDFIFGHHEEGSYVLEVDTSFLQPEEYAIWIVFDYGATILVPIVVLAN